MIEEFQHLSERKITESKRKGVHVVPYRMSKLNKLDFSSRTSGVLTQLTR